MGAPSNSQRHARAIAEADATVAAEGASIAEVIGQTVALYLADLLRRLPLQPECAVCIDEAKQAIRAYQVFVANALKASEPVPNPPASPPVAQSVTWQDGSPVCFSHYQVSDGQPVSAP